jgi:COP9 signalosome complex subunit 2
MDEDYDFDYEDDMDQDDDGNVDLENLYYNAKAYKEDDPAKARSEFLSVVDKEDPPGEWGFKALKQLVKMNFGAHDFTHTLEHYKRLLTYTKSAVTRNYGEKSLNSILDYVSASPDTEFMERFYRITLDALSDQKNDRLWMKTNLKLAKLWLDRHEYTRLGKILRQLHEACQNTDGTNDLSKGTHLLEVYALEIQMHTQTRNNKKLKELYQKSLTVKSAIPHPRIMGVIRECGGKMHMNEQDWDKAKTDFSESFRNYDEAGSPQRIQVLKYLVLASMLSETEINPFDSQETKPYANDPQIVAMTNLVEAYQKKDVMAFERILHDNRASILGDAFIKNYIDDVLKSIRTQFLVDIIKPYTRVQLSFLARHLNIAMAEVEELIAQLILEERIKGRMDQVKHILELDKAHKHDKRYNVMNDFSRNVGALFTTTATKFVN